MKIAFGASAPINPTHTDQLNCKQLDLSFQGNNIILMALQNEVLWRMSELEEQT
jgi:hypothetical protein